MKKFWSKLSVLAAFVTLLLAGMFAVSCLTFPDVYKNNYQKGFVYQYRALQRSDPAQNKIIVIGGSYMTFGIDSARLAEQLGMPAYTLGVHSGMGMDYIIETAEKFLNPGDILVFPFRPYETGQYGMDLIYLSLDNEYDMLRDFFIKHPWKVIQSAGTALYNKLYSPLETIVSRRIWPEMATGEIYSVYDARAFDPQTGNLIYKREEGPLLPDSELYKENKMDIQELSIGCIRQVNEFAEVCRDRDVGFFMLYCPFFPGYYGSPAQADMMTYQRDLEQAFHTEFIVDIPRCAVPKDYTYNAALHMNDAGARYYTDLLAEGLRARLS